MPSPNATSVDTYNRTFTAVGTAMRLAFQNAVVTTMVCLNGHSRMRQTHRGQEYRGRAWQGAVLDKQAIRVGCHLCRIYTMKPWCSNRGVLRGSSLASKSKNSRHIPCSNSMHIMEACPLTHAACWDTLSILFNCYHHGLPRWSWPHCGRHTVDRNIEAGPGKELYSTSKPTV